MSITDYASLKTTVGLWLNRSDLTSALPTYVQLAEATLNREEAVRRRSTVDFVVDSQDETLPVDLIEIKSLAHVGPNVFGPISLVSPDDEARRRFTLGWVNTTGCPRDAYPITPTTLRFSPIPDQAYTVELVYESGLPALSDAAPTNWLLVTHPDIYLYATLLETAPYLKNDARLATWQKEYDKRIAQLLVLKERQDQPTTVVRRPSRALGE